MLSEQADLHEIDDHCLVHHFIRIFGYRPSADQLQALRESGLVARVRHDSPPLNLPRVVRRQAARLIHHL